MSFFNKFKKKNKQSDITIEREQNDIELPKIWEEVSNFDYNKPYDGILKTKINNIDLPKDYLDFMLKHNGGEGDLGATWFVLYPLEELEEINKEIDDNLTDSIIIGSNGAGELYGVNSNGEYFNVPAIIEKEYITLLGKDFNSLPNRINQLWK